MVLLSQWGTPSRQTICASSMAPAAARMPQRMSMPSRAGPAAQEQENMVPPRLSTISPLVPISISRLLPGMAARSQVSMPAVISPPT